MTGDRPAGSSHGASMSAAIERVEAELRALHIEVTRAATTLAVFGHDESDQGDFAPDAVAFALSTLDVQNVLKVCAAANVPVTPAGARTGKSGGSLPVHGGLSLSLEKMNKIIELNCEDLIIRVQPGVVLADLAKAVEAKGLFYPPDPNSWETCTIGGNIATNAGGPRALKYGVTKDYVLGLEWVMPGGELIRTGKRTSKGVVGYDLTGLFVGSEGTLGVATEITLKLIPLPRKVMTALLPFDSVDNAARLVSAILTQGILPRALELLDDVAIGAIDGKGFTFPVGCGACLIAEVDGFSEEGVLLELTALTEVAAQFGARETLVAQDDAQREKLWAIRRMVSPSLRAVKKFKFSEDVVVPRSKIPEAIRRFKAAGVKLGLTVATYGHAGDGNLHTNVLYAGPHERPQVNLALAEIMQITVDLGGTLSGEHGIGIAKARFLALEQDPALISLQKKLKAFFDPRGLVNPGKIFPSH